jgi:alpha-tubulin suppressor-like RCC1 family protein
LVGLNQHGEVAHGASDPEKFHAPSCPNFEYPLPTKKVIAVALGQFHLLVIASDIGEEQGKLYVSGCNQDGQLGLENKKNCNQLTMVTSEVIGENFVQVAAGYSHSMALTGDGKIFSFGNNNFGQLGLGSQAHNGCFYSPQRVLVKKNIQFSKIKCGAYSSMAITKQNDLYFWGKMGLPYPCKIDVPGVVLDVSAWDADLWVLVTHSAE